MDFVLLVAGDEVENTDDLCPPLMMVIKLFGCLVAVDGEEDKDKDEFVDGFRTTFLSIVKNNILLTYHHRRR